MKDIDYSLFKGAKTLSLSDLALLHEAYTLLQGSRHTTLAEIASDLQTTKGALYKKLRRLTSRLARTMGIQQRVFETTQGVGTRIHEDDNLKHALKTIGEVLKTYQQLSDRQRGVKRAVVLHVGMSHLLALRLMPRCEQSFYADAKVKEWSAEREIQLEVEIDEPYDLIERVPYSEKLDLIVAGSGQSHHSNKGRDRKRPHQFGCSFSFHKCLIMRREHLLAGRKDELRERIDWEALKEYRFVLLQERRLLPDFPWDEIDRVCRKDKCKLVSTYLEAHSRVLGDPYLPANAIHPQEIAVSHHEVLTPEEEEGLCVIDLPVDDRTRDTMIVLLRPPKRYRTRDLAEQAIVDRLADIIERELTTITREYAQALDRTKRLRSYQFAYHVSRHRSPTDRDSPAKWYRSNVELEACAGGFVKGKYEVASRPVSKPFYLFGRIHTLEEGARYHLHWHEIPPGDPHALFSFVFPQNALDGFNPSKEPIIGYWLGLSSWGRPEPYFGPVVLCTAEDIKRLGRSPANLNRLVREYNDRQGLFYRSATRDELPQAFCEGSGKNG